jgi:hypothetical protein
VSGPDPSPELRRIADHDEIVRDGGREYGFCADTGLRYVFDWDAKECAWERDHDDRRYVAARKSHIERLRSKRARDWRQS